jgi:hypothetical protein
MTKQEIINKALDEFPNTANLTLAKKIYNENKLLFGDVESIRTAIRTRKGSKGIESLKKLKDDKYLTQEKRILKYNLPESIETIYEPFVITGNKGLIFGDVHVPFHSIQALESMFNYTINKDLDFIILNGDISDMFDLSKFDKEPDKSKIVMERDKTKQFLIELKRIYPKAKIYYKFGNHEARWISYLINKAPEIFGFREFRWEVLLDLFNLGIEFIEDDKYIDLSGLSILHSHEYKNGITSPANPARTLFLRTKATSLGAHNHQSSEHTETSIDGKVITCWSIGCMCELNPKYMPLNKWNHGFALYTREEDTFWNIENKRIIKGRVV